MRWRQELDTNLGLLYERLLRPVHERLRQQLGSGEHPLVIVPSRALSILPLHACWWEEAGQRRYLIDEFIISYAPSLTMLNITWNRKPERTHSDLFVGVRGQGLEWAATELEGVRSLVSGRLCRELRFSNTKDELWSLLKDARWVHFAAHAEYDWTDPLNSHIQLEDNNELLLREVLHEISLAAELVVLSVCEASLKHPHDLTEEQLSLATAFLIAGAKAA